jgi:hypothetical protein
MTLVVVERNAQSAAHSECVAREQAASAYLTERSVRALAGYVSRDQRASVCLYEAPSAEAVQLAHSALELPFERVWAAQAVRFADRDTAGPNLHTVVTTRTPPIPPTAGLMRTVTLLGRGCLRTHRTTPLISYLALKGSRTVCIFEAPDTESVRVANRRMWLPIEDAWRATYVVCPPAAARVSLGP